MDAVHVGFTTTIWPDTPRGRIRSRASDSIPIPLSRRLIVPSAQMQFIFEHRSEGYVSVGSFLSDR
jgi:hypothetical protein